MEQDKCLFFFFYLINSDRFLQDKLLQECLRRDTSSRADGQLHLRDFPVDVLHELNDKVDKFVAEHRLSVLVGDQEADVVVGADRLATKDQKLFSTLSQETHESFAKDSLK